MSALPVPLLSASEDGRAYSICLDRYGYHTVFIRTYRYTIMAMLDKARLPGTVLKKYLPYLLTRSS
eukprot:scaffold12564_cov60-Attheya_sp.AAC.2